MNINEIKKQFKLLTSYTPTKTLTENIESILMVEGMGETAISVAQTFKDILSNERGLFSQFKNEIPAFSRFKNADELIRALETVGKDGSVLKNSEVIGIAKDLSKTSPEIAAKLKGMIGKSGGFYDIARQVYPNGAAMGADAKALKMTQDYYKQFGIEAKDVERMLQDSIQKGKGGGKIGKDLGKDLGKDSKILGKDLDKSGQNIIDDVLKNPTKPKRYWRTKFKRWGWIDDAGKLTSKGRRRIVQVLGGAALLWWMTSGNDDEVMPKPIPEPKPIPVVDPNPIVNPTYTNCTNFPYKKGCQSPIIAEVQKCLGLTDDGKFGLTTEEKLKSLGYGTEITKEVYDKIKLNCGSSTNTITTPTTTLSYDQQYGISPNPNQAETGSGYETISMDDFN